MFKLSFRKEINDYTLYLTRQIQKFIRNTSVDEKFELEQPAYKRGNFQSNNVAL